MVCIGLHEDHYSFSCDDSPQEKMGGHEEKTGGHGWTFVSKQSYILYDHKLGSKANVYNSLKMQYLSFVARRGKLPEKGPPKLCSNHWHQTHMILKNTHVPPQTPRGLQHHLHPWKGKNRVSNVTFYECGIWGQQALC